MGVRNFRFIPWSWSSLDEIRGAVAIDVPNYMTRRIAVLRHKRGTERVPLQHVRILMGIVRSALGRNILPVFVLDGPPERLKRKPNPSLVQLAHRLYSSFSSSLDPYDEEIVEVLSESPAVRHYFIQSHIRDLASAMGVPAVLAPSEAELYAAVMCRDALVKTVVTNDVDAFLFGSPHVTKQLVLTRSTILRATLDGVLHVTELSLSQLRDLAVLLGCDFHKEGLHGVGPHRGILLLRRHGDLESVLRSQGLRSSEREVFLSARLAYDEADYVKPTESELELNAPLPDRLAEMLRPALGQEAAASLVRELLVLWRRFSRRQTRLEEWL
ncbi:MAG: hypothetical protein ACTSPE_10140 [Candidatus Thorarchaeota archaeon]